MSDASASDLRGVRCLLGMLGLDVHNKGIRTLAGQLRDRGAEVIYLGEHNTAAGMARAAVADDVHVVGISFSTTTYLTYTRELVDALAAEGAADIPVLVGGLIHSDDETALGEIGAAGVFGPGSGIDAIVTFLRKRCLPLSATPQQPTAATAEELYGHLT